MPLDPRDTPVLIIVFNRPDKVERLMAALAESKPRHLYVAADGPRSHRPDDVEKCVKTRALATAVTWDCEVHTYFADTNKGCRLGVSSGITWFFSQVPEGIILEDDCIPDASFFTYASTLLERYRDTPTVMHINGTNFLTKAESIAGTASYNFSNIPLVWGWASWRRAWDLYDITTKNIDSLKEVLYTNHSFANKSHAYYWHDHCRHIVVHNIDTWDAQWVYSILINRGICVTPTVNMIENVGFDQDATHTTEASSIAQTSTAITTDLIAPPLLVVNKQFDAKTMRKAFIDSPKKRLKYFIKSRLGL